MPLLYSFVSRDKTVIAEYSACNGNFSSVALEILQKVSNPQGNFSTTCDDHTFNFLVSNEYTYLVVSDENSGKELPLAFLTRIKEAFEAKFATKGQTAAAGSLDKAFGPRMQQEMKYCQDNPGEVSKIAAIQAKVNEVRNVMVDNIDKVLQRGERIEVLVDKTEELKEHANAFEKKAKTLRNKMWCEACKMQMVFAMVIIVVILIIVLSVCLTGGFCKRKTH